MCFLWQRVQKVCVRLPINVLFDLDINFAAKILLKCNQVVPLKTWGPACTIECQEEVEWIAFMEATFQHQPMRHGRQCAPIYQHAAFASQRRRTLLLRKKRTVPKARKALESTWRTLAGYASFRAHAEKKPRRCEKKKYEPARPAPESLHK